MKKKQVKKSDSIKPVNLKKFLFPAKVGNKKILIEAENIKEAYLKYNNI